MKDFLNKNKETIIKWLIILAVCYIVYKNWWRVEGMLKPVSRDNSPEALSDTRKNSLETIAGEMYNDIYHTPLTGHDYSSYTKIVAMYDNEVIYLADYYKNHLANGNKLYTDINSQWYTWGNTPNELMTKLSELGKS